MGWHRHWQVSLPLNPSFLESKMMLDRSCRCAFSSLCQFCVILVLFSLLILCSHCCVRSLQKAGGSFCSLQGILSANVSWRKTAKHVTLLSHPPSPLSSSCSGIMTVCATCREGESFKNKWIKITFLLYGDDVPLSTLVERSSFG